jgi:hypothetical protein
MATVASNVETALAKARKATRAGDRREEAPGLRVGSGQKQRAPRGCYGERRGCAPHPSRGLNHARESLNGVATTPLGRRADRRGDRLERLHWRGSWGEQRKRGSSHRSERGVREQHDSAPLRPGGFHYLCGAAILSGLPGLQPARYGLRPVRLRDGRQLGCAERSEHRNRDRQRRRLGERGERWDNDERLGGRRRQYRRDGRWSKRTERSRGRRTKRTRERRNACR